MATINTLENGQAGGGLLTAPIERETVTTDDISHVVMELSNLSLSSLSKEQLRQVAGMAAMQTLLEELKIERLLASYDVGQLVTDWLNSLRSIATQRSYRTAINGFLKWVTDNRLHVLTARPKDIDSYASFCRAEYKAGKANLYINVASSFYSTLQKWEIRQSPCISVKRAVTGYTVKNLPTGDQIKELAEKAPSDLGVAIELMAATGLRVGSLHSLKINRRKYTGISKGKTIDGTLPKGITAGDLAMIQANSKDSFLKRLERYLAPAGIKPHDLRHYFAVKVYQESGKDIEAVRRALGHSNIAITTTYLQGLPLQ